MAVTMSGACRTEAAPGEVVSGGNQMPGLGRGHCPTSPPLLPFAGVWEAVSASPCTGMGAGLVGHMEDKPAE